MDDSTFQDAHFTDNLRERSFQDEIMGRIEISKPQTDYSLNHEVQNNSVGHMSPFVSNYSSPEDEKDTPINMLHQIDPEEEEAVAPRSTGMYNGNDVTRCNRKCLSGPESKFSNLTNGWILYNKKRFVPHPNKFGKLCEPEAHSRICSCMHRNCRKIRLEGACQGVVKYKMSIRESAWVWGVKKSTLQENLANVRYRTQIEYLTNLVEDSIDK